MRGKRHDAQRTAWLAPQGFRVLRFWNPEVLGDMAAVQEVIMRAVCGEAPLSLTLPHGGGRGQASGPRKTWIPAPRSGSRAGSSRE